LHNFARFCIKRIAEIVQNRKNRQKLLKRQKNCAIINWASVEAQRILQNFQKEKKYK
jgi:hypothetical protein